MWRQSLTICDVKVEAKSHEIDYDPKTTPLNARDNVHCTLATMPNPT